MFQEIDNNEFVAEALVSFCCCWFCWHFLFPFCDSCYWVLCEIPSCVGNLLCRYHKYLALQNWHAPQLSKATHDLDFFLALVDFLASSVAGKIAIVDKLSFCFISWTYFCWAKILIFDVSGVARFVRFLKLYRMWQFINNLIKHYMIS